MGIIEVEWNFGKSYADKIIIWMFQVIIYYTYHYFRLLLNNFLKFRSKSKVPSFKSIDFTRNVFPIFFIFVAIPLVVFFGILIYLPDKVTGFGSVILVAMSLAIVIIVAFLAYRFVIDLLVSGVCLIRSFIVTTAYSIRYLGRKKN